MLNDSLSNDTEFRAMLLTDIESAQKSLDSAEIQLLQSLVKKDSADFGNCILEIRAGTGGEEAALFAGDVMQMYHRYSELRGWKFELVSSSEPSTKRIKVTFICNSRMQWLRWQVLIGVLTAGRNVFGALKFETGVHRYFLILMKECREYQLLKVPAESTPVL